MARDYQRFNRQLKHSRFFRFSEWRLPLIRTRWSRRKTYVVIGIILGVSLLYQLLYPSDRLLPNARIDGVPLGGQSISNAINQLNQAYKKYTIKLVGDNNVIATPTIEKLALNVDNTERLQSVEYPWFWRIVPLSALWWQPTLSSGSPKISTTNDTTQYITKNIMPICKRSPVNASLRAQNGKLIVVSARRGGECDQSAVVRSIATMSPTLKQDTSITIPMRGLAPVIATDQAEELKNKITKAIDGGVALKVGEQTITLPAREVTSWVTTIEKDAKLIASIDATLATDYLNKNITPKVAKEAGVTRVTTRDLAEVSRSNGAPGQTLDIEATTQQLSEVINQTRSQAVAVTKIVPPRVEYSRSYSATDTGLNALLKQYAEDHPGTYGISLMELSGKKRSANYNGDKQFITASTYKLYVGYSVLKRVETSGWRWEDNQTCFNKMISLSDNPCAENYLRVIGLSAVTKDANDLGFANTTFTKSGGPYTTANDLARFMAMLEVGQGYSGVNRERFISALKANVYRKGIPAGTSAVVADKVGFLNGLLHDSAIVYSPRGAYTLAVLTDGSSWANISELTKKIEELRSQP